MTSTALATQPKPQILAGAPVAALVPKSLEEAFRVSQAIAASGLAPKGIDKPEQILVAIMAGAELGLAPFQSLQSIAVVNGRATLWGDGLVAVVRSHGVKIAERIEGSGEALVATCDVTRPDTEEVVTRQFTVAQAKKAGLWGKAGPWTQYPERMMQMRARGYALRDACADLLRGFQIREEVEDYQPIRDVTQPQATGLRARLEARTPVGGFSADHVSAELDEALSGDRLPAHDALTGEIIEGAVVDPPAVDDPAMRDDFPGDRPSTIEQTQGPTLAMRVDAYLSRIGEAKTTIKMKALRGAAETLRKEVDAADPERLVEIEEVFNAKYLELEEAEKAARL